MWRPSKQGDTLALEVPVAEAGKHVLHLALALDRNAGVVSVQFDGSGAGFGGESGTIDLYRPHRTLLRQFRSRVVELTKGAHVLTLRFEGPSQGGSASAIGIDYLAVQKR